MSPRKKAAEKEPAKKRRRRTPALTPEAVIKRLWEEAQLDSLEGKLKARCPVQGAAPRISALKALAEYFGIIKGGGAADEGMLPELPIIVETGEEGTGEDA